MRQGDKKPCVEDMIMVDLPVQRRWSDRIRSTGRRGLLCGRYNVYAVVDNNDKREVERDRRWWDEVQARLPLTTL